MNDLQILREGWGQPERPSSEAWAAARVALLQRQAAPAGPTGRRRAVGGRAGWLASGLALAAAATAACVLALTPPGSGPGHQGVLTAFTVTRHAGTVDVTLRELSRTWSAADRAALLAKLRADGVPAIAGYRWHPASGKCYASPLVGQVIVVTARRLLDGIAFEIRPARIPPGVRVVFAVLSPPAEGPDHIHRWAAIIPGLLVTSSGRCLAPATLSWPGPSVIQH
jgi:hypothetical protein